MRETLRLVAVAAVTALLVGAATATAASLISGKQIENGSITRADIQKGTISMNRLTRGTQSLIRDRGSNKAAQGQGEITGLKGDKGDRGPQGPQGPKGDKGDRGEPAANKVTSLPSRGFSATNDNVSLTPDGVEFGPLDNGGGSGGSLKYEGLDGRPLSAIRSLAYVARYTSEGDTNGVGAPYLRVFTKDSSGTTHDLVFSPNTQPPDPDVAEGPFHTWVATSGVWRYDDDAGAGGEYGLTGAPFATVVADHGDQTIDGVYITTGFSAGTSLEALLRSWEIDGTTYAFRGS